MSGLLHPIDIYCERLDASLWAEPVNAVSNIAFLVTAYLLAREMKAVPVHQARLWWLIGFIAMVGVGSGLFHIFANRITMLMDVIPIALFLLSYIWVFVRYVCRWSVFVTFTLIVIFLLLGYATRFVPPALQLNGTISYAPAFIYIIALAYSARRLLLAVSLRYLKWAIVLFFCSMVMRSVDMMWCDVWPVGTHFMWHMGNGVALYFAIKALIVDQSQRN